MIRRAARKSYSDDTGSGAINSTRKVIQIMLSMSHQPYCNHLAATAAFFESAEIKHVCCPDSIECKFRICLSETPYYMDQNQKFFLVLFGPVPTLEVRWVPLYVLLPARPRYRCPTDVRNLLSLDVVVVVGRPNGSVVLKLSKGREREPQQYGCCR